MVRFSVNSFSKVPHPHPYIGPTEVTASTTSMMDFQKSLNVKKVIRKPKDNSINIYAKILIVVIWKNIIPNKLAAGGLLLLCYIFLIQSSQ